MRTDNSHELIDQASHLRAMVRGRTPVATTIAVTSGKGGVGKTNLAVNLAIALSARGRRVTLVDADLGLANADLLLNVSPRFNLSHVITGQRRMDEIVCRASGGIDFVPGASGMERLANLIEYERQSVLQQMHALERGADAIILDCGAGISRNVIAFAAAADSVLVICTPEPTALADAYATIKMVQRERTGAKLHLLVNMAESRAEARTVFRRVASVAEQFLKYPIAEAGYILQDAHVAMAVRRRTPFVLSYPRCAASCCVMAIAARLADLTSDSRHDPGFFGRVMSMFL